MRCIRCREFLICYMVNEITYREIDTTIRGDASPQVKGFLYQFLVALQFCLEMKSNQALYIENFGDFAIKTAGEGESISAESKHYSTTKIHLLHNNVINTLYNWAQPNFHQEHYSKLLLITTQDVREGDALNLIIKTDNKYKVFVDELNKEVNRIKDKLKEDKKVNPKATLSTDKEKTMKQLEYLCDVEHKNVVQEILCKWVMNAGCLDFKELYESIVNRYASMLEERKGELYIDGLFAMIINPGIVEKGWCIKREDFKKRQQELNSDFSTKNISFPTIGEPTEAETEGLGSSLFVEKLRIANLEREIARAIHDYVKTNNLIMREIKGRPVRDVGLEKYKDNLRSLFESHYNAHTVEFTFDPNQNVFKSSQKFYYAMQNACLQVKMEPLNSVDVYFAKGVLHILADDKTLNVKWIIDGTSI